jgi:hypothetical protein
MFCAIWGYGLAHAISWQQYRQGEVYKRKRMRVMEMEKQALPPKSIEEWRAADELKRLTWPR